MENILINGAFEKAIQRLRSILPKLSFGLLIATYLISAIIMGIFHAQTANNLGFMIAAFLVPLAIQCGRGTLVFFFQLNPARIQHRFSMGVIAASVLLILSLLEAYFVLKDYGLAWIISVSSLMLIGWLIEIMIMKEITFATQIALFRDREKWTELKDFYNAKAELEGLMKGKVLVASPTPDISTEVTPEDSQALELLKELNQHLLGKVESPSLNGHQA
ncbi:MAG: hypothetical protein AAFO07_02380 [Bacteroidota bacterium]